jgi:hypothetical protein
MLKEASVLDLIWRQSNQLKNKSVLFKLIIWIIGKQHLNKQHF